MFLWNDDSITLMPNLIYALLADASRSLCDVA